MKLICIGNNLLDTRKIKEFATKNKYTLQVYSEESWKKRQKKNHKLSTNGHQNKSSSSAPASVPAWRGYNNIFQSMDDVKIQTIQSRLIMCQGNVTKASQILHIGRATLYRIIKQFDIDLSSIRYHLCEEEKPDRLKRWKKSA